MTRVRVPAAAGSFYPARRPEVLAMVDGMLEAAVAAHAHQQRRLARSGAPGTLAPGEPGAGTQAPGGPLPAAGEKPATSTAPPAGATEGPAKPFGDLVALVVPHAGYIYSGPIAATAYRLLRGSGRGRICLLGPAHFVPLRGCAVPRADAWATPLGDMPIDAELRDLASALGARVDDAPHEPEHSIEVQLPFLQRVMTPAPRILPVAVGLSRAADVAALIAQLSAHAFVIVSTDLSHYHDVETARRLDRRTAEAIVARDAAAIGVDDACGAFALRGIVEHARLADLQVELLDLRSSADTAGDPWRVVGYGALAFRRPADSSAAVRSVSR